MKLGHGLGLTMYRRTGSSPLLDAFPGAAFAFDINHELTAGQSTAVVEVRRSSGSPSEDTFTFSEVSDGTLTTWVGGGNDGLVKNIYNESGSAVFSQTTTSRQPKIVSSGSLVTLNGKAAIEWDGTAHHMEGGAFFGAGETDVTIFIVGAYTQSGQSNDSMFLMSDSGGYGGVDSWMIKRQRLSTNRVVFNNSSTQEEVVNGTSDTSQHLFYIRFKGSTTIDFGIDGAAAVSETATVPASITPNNRIELGALRIGGSLFNYGAIKIQSIIAYDSDQSANRTAIEDAINSYYSIY